MTTGYGGVMTDRVVALTVFLEQQTRTDDVKELMNAIKQLRGVSTVRIGKVADMNTEWAYQQARRELGEALWNVLYPEDKRA